ncbi:MAG: alcohol dehydrogenase catalytic domain-containing protein [Halioglobus sp.]|nr:alcohol dehydrogenase catalytic domain-containing protein [Halioglobus sp.]
MKAVRCCDRKVHVVDVPEPSGEGVLVEVRSAGICGSDLHMIEHGFPIPGTLGHEVAGTLRDGRAVALEPMAPCGHCDMCLSGDYFSCRRGAGMLYGVGLDGGMADRILVPERCIVPLPDNVRVGDACLVEPLAVAVHGIDMLDLTPASRVAVIGAGAVGLAATAVLTSRLEDVHVAARHPAQQEAAQRLGACLEPEGEFDVVVECAGNSAALAEAARLCRPGGIVLLLATYWEDVSLPAADVCLKSLKLYASFLYGRRGLVRDVEAAAYLLSHRPGTGGYPDHPSPAAGRGAGGLRRRR